MTIAPDAFLETIRAIVARVVERAVPELTLDIPIRSLGIDSILLAETAVGVDDTFGIDMPNEAWAKVTTVRELMAVVAASPRIK